MKLFADHVAEALAHDAARDMHRYLVIDTAATRPVNMCVELAVGATGVDVLTGQSCQWRECASPVLVELPSSALGSAFCRIARESISKWRFANCFLYIESRFELAVMVRLLRERTEAMLPQDVPVLLRYFDPRVFAALMGTLGEGQAADFLAAGSHWAVPGRRGELTTMSCAAESSSAFEPPLLLTPIQEAALIDAGDADAMVDLLLNQNNETLMNLMPPDQHDCVQAALEAASAFRIDLLGDQVAFCALTLALGSDFHQREPWVVPMADVQTGRRPFSDALARVAESEAA